MRLETDLRTARKLAVLGCGIGCGCTMCEPDYSLAGTRAEVRCPKAAEDNPLGGAAEGVLERVGKLLQQATIVETSDAAKIRASDRALNRKTP